LAKKGWVEKITAGSRGYEKGEDNKSTFPKGGGDKT